MGRVKVIWRAGFMRERVKVFWTQVGTIGLVWSWLNREGLMTQLDLSLCLHLSSSNLHVTTLIPAYLLLPNSTHSIPFLPRHPAVECYQCPVSHLFLLFRASSCNRKIHLQNFIPTKWHVSAIRYQFRQRSVLRCPCELLLNVNEYDTVILLVKCCNFV